MSLTPQSPISCAKFPWRVNCGIVGEKKEELMFYKLFAESGTRPGAFIYELPNLILMPNF